MSMRRLVFVLAWISALSAGPARAAGSEPFFSMGVSGKAVETMTVSEMRRRVGAPVEIEVPANPSYQNRPMRYRGFDFSTLVKRLSLTRPLTDYKVIFNCTDGYRPVVDGEIFQNEGSFIAFREIDPDKGLVTDDGLWTKAKQGERLVSPGPFYLVWNRADAPEDAWPYQIASVLFVEKEKFNLFKDIAPRGDAGAASYRGFEVFSKTCTVCHSIRYVGAQGRAPDLDRKSTRLNSSHMSESRMPSSA